MAYINKGTGRIISDSEYEDHWNQEDYTKIKKDTSTRDSIFLGAVTDSALLGGLLGGDIIGGAIGDLLDGDLMD